MFGGAEDPRGETVGTASCEEGTETREGEEVDADS